MKEMKLVRHRINVNQMPVMVNNAAPGILKVSANESTRKTLELVIPEGATVTEIRDEFAKMAKQNKGKVEKLFKTEVGASINIGKHAMEVKEVNKATHSSYGVSVTPTYEEGKDRCWRDETFIVDWDYRETDKDGDEDF